MDTNRMRLFQQVARFDQYRVRPPVIAMVVEQRISWITHCIDRSLYGPVTTAVDSLLGHLDAELFRLERAT